MPQFTIIKAIAILLIGSVALYADDPVIPGANLGKSSTLPPPPRSAVKAKPQMQPQPDPATQNRDALTRPVPGYQGGHMSEVGTSIGYLTMSFRKLVLLITTVLLRARVVLME